jgi:hypothetical protein
MDIEQGHINEAITRFGGSEGWWRKAVLRAVEGVLKERKAMDRIGRYWASVREVESTLPAPDVYVKSGRMVVQVSREIAARMIVGNQARLASEGEVTEHLAAEEVKRRGIHAVESMRQAHATTNAVEAVRPACTTIIVSSTPQAPGKKAR